MFHIPTICGTIDRRILVNYRADPDVVANLLPSPFRPNTVAGRAIVGICLIRLKQVRPRGLPRWLGIGSENAAHRFAVEWEADGQRREGVYIPRRDTDSRLNALVGGRLFPGVHHHADFDVDERPDRYSIGITSDDGAACLQVVGTPADVLPETSVFESLEAASKFFQAGSLGYSDARRAGRMDGLELQCFRWDVEPLAVETVESSYFEDTVRFPAGTLELDHALLMRDIDHEWHQRDELCRGGAAAVVPAGLVRGHR